MNTIADYTTAELILTEVKSSDTPELITKLIDALDREGRLVDRGVFLNAVMARESLSPTSCSPGWALPHARLRALPQLSFALAHTSQPLAWMGNQGAEVKIVWLFAVPEFETRTYLNLVAAVARLSQDAALLAQLMQARDALTIYRVLQQIPLRVTRSPMLTAATTTGPGRR